MRRLALIAAVVALAPRAEAEVGSVGQPLHVDFLGEGDDEGDLEACILLPYARCRGSFDVSIEYGGGKVWGMALQDLEEDDYLQLAVDAGYLFALSSSPSFQLGPTVGFEAEIFDESLRYTLFLTARGRLWLWQWVTIEAALGPAAGLARDGSPVAVGGFGELAVTAHGHLGAFVQTLVMEGPDGLETRVCGGFRGSFTAWAILIAGMG